MTKYILKFHVHDPKDLDDMGGELEALIAVMAVEWYEFPIQPIASVTIFIHPAFEVNLNLIAELRKVLDNHGSLVARWS